MVYPKHIEWNGRITGHAPRRRSQRELVASSLLCVPATRIRWDERTRSEYRTRAR
jgi:hypothetical protein